MGDIMLDRAVGQHFRSQPDAFAMPEIATVLRDYDLVFANLENPVGVNGSPHPIQNPNVTFCCHPESLKVLKNLGVSVVSLGNNHMLDYGPVSLEETLHYLDANGIRHVGAGRNYEEANRPLLTTIKGNQVAILSYVFLYSASTERATRSTAGVSDHRIHVIIPRIRDLVRAGYQVLVSVHWGAEYSFFPLPYQMRQARQMIDAGATMIIGHGPHYPQGIETYKGGKIIYSLGNFIFDEPFLYANRSFIYGIEIEKSNQLGNEKMYPVHIRNHVPSLVRGKDEERMRRLVKKLSELYGTRRKRFWQRQNSLYFGDIVHRVQYMKSLKFIALPPVSFYMEVGARNYARKLLPRRLKHLLA